MVDMDVSEESRSRCMGFDCSGNENVDLEPPLEQQEASSRDNSLPSMGHPKPNSILSLTLEEIKCKSGRNFGSMNMDEFLANIWSVEEEQPDLGGQGSASDKDTTFHPSTLPGQGSFSIPNPLCKKTVDEVWSEIDKSRPQYHDPNNKFGNFGPPQRQQTIGEITLEDFLVKAGVVQESPSESKTSQKRMESTQIEQQCGNTSMEKSFNTCLDTSFEIGGQMFDSGYLNPQNAVSGTFSANGYTISNTYPMLGRQTKMVVGEPSYASEIDKCHSMPELSSGGGTKNKKRIIDGPQQVVVERRQRRIIKNRESAARSRARKQAYTVELEAELNQLMEENTKLKQNVAESEGRQKLELLRRKQAAESTTQAQKLTEKLRTLRRAVSSA